MDEDAFLDGSFADIEKRLLDKILTKYHRDPDKAADALALNRARFFNKLSKYQLI
jgi:DNA-binding protein Fis